MMKNLFKNRKGFTPTPTLKICHSYFLSFILQNIFKRNFLHKRKLVSGFTLIEMLLYVAISSTMLIALVGGLSVVLESRVRNQTSAEVEQQGLQVMQIITQTIRNADAINSPTAGNASSSISLKTFSTSTNPTIFDLSNGAMRITEATGTPVALTNSHVTVSNVSFQNLSRMSTTGTVRINFQIDYLGGNSTKEYVFSKTFNGSATIR